ncbi:MAG: bifunctional oligoribonuclease/PAP phosphatase NrnA [Parcubacteria group bacterium]|jgi:phosphoesterase RecJ-like protein
MKSFVKEFTTLNYIINKSNNVLLFAHTNPDGDTIGANLALREYIASLGKKVDIACFDPFPNYLNEIFHAEFVFPDKLDMSSYDAVIACDSVERGFDRIFEKISLNQATVLIDHHPDIHLQGDANIMDSSCSSVCEMIYRFFVFCNLKITKEIATCLMAGILGDTGSFQHSNTSTYVMNIASDLMKKGAPISKIVDIVFANKKISTLKLWGRAFEKAKINPRNGMIATVLTEDDIKDCEASTEDIAQVASILNTVPGTKFSLILSQREGDNIKGSLRSEEYKGVDVSEIAHQFGGGGHKLASGFEVKGKIVETEEGWEIV